MRDERVMGGSVCVCDIFETPFSEFLETPAKRPFNAGQDCRSVGCVVTALRVNAFANLAGISVRANAIIDLRRVKGARSIVGPSAAFRHRPNLEAIEASFIINEPPTAFRTLLAGSGAKSTRGA